MSRMEATFEKMMLEGEKILVSYFPLGDNYVKNTVEWAGKFYNNGTTVLELGLPYEHPFLDGTVVADSMARALERTTLEKVLQEVREIRYNFPDKIIQIMTYVENIEKFGIIEFAKIVHQVGADAVLAPNASSEQMKELDICLNAYNIHNLRFVPYHIDDAVLSDLKKNARGYIYLQAIDGKTGASGEITTQIKDNIELLRREEIEIPLIPGFGISTAEHIKTYLNMGADGVVVGSAIIKRIIEGTGETYIRELRNALK